RGLGDQPRATLICEVRVRPLQQNTKSVTEADEIRDVDSEPQEPREPSTHLDLPAEQVRDRLSATDRREVALVEIIEVGAWPSFDGCDYVPRSNATFLHGYLRDA